MAVDRRDPSSAIPELERRITRLEKLTGGYVGEFAKAIHRHEREDVVGLSEELAKTDKGLEDVSKAVGDISAEVAAVKEAIEAEHPIGSYYMSSDPTEPSILFGGTWESVSIEPFEYCWRRIEEAT